MSKKVSVFNNRSPTYVRGPSGTWPQRTAFLAHSERTILGGIFTRISIDVAAATISHAKVDENGFLVNFPDSKLNEALRLKPNINQTPSALKREIVQTMFNDGVAIVVPVDRTDDGEVVTLQVGTALEWFPEDIRVNLWNNAKQSYEDVILPKDDVAIIENPFYTVMNDNASAVKRLMHMLGDMDAYSAAALRGKLNVFVGLPYDMGNDWEIERAQRRIDLIDRQMTNNTYGIAYIGSEDKVTQLNKPLDIDILEQVKELETELYAQMGISKDVFTGEADEQKTRDYEEKTKHPILTAITEAMTAANWVQGSRVKRPKDERIIYTTDVFAGMTGKDMADATDVYRRNGIILPNEVRARLGLLKSEDPTANSLANMNMPLQDQVAGAAAGAPQQQPESRNLFNSGEENVETKSNIFV